MKQDHKKPIYLISPYVREFLIFDNRLFQFRDLFKENPEFAENKDIKFSQILRELSANSSIRVITSDDEESKPCLDELRLSNNIEIRIESPKLDHQKAFLSELFYFEGSMNFTYSGLYRNKEKITCNAVTDPEGQEKISKAYLEFDRSWKNLPDN